MPQQPTTLDHAFTVVANSRTDLERLGINLRMVDPSIYWEIVSAYEMPHFIGMGAIAFAISSEMGIYYYLIVWPKQLPS